MKKRTLGENLELLAYLLVIVGFVAMCQPFVMVFYTYGFNVVLAGVILMNIAPRVH
jgi:hypothetical protein